MYVHVCVYVHIYINLILIVALEGRPCVIHLLKIAALKDREVE